MSIRIAVIAGLVLLVVSLAGVGLSFARPVDRTVKQQVKLLEYQQAGSFDYEVVSRPSLLYDGASDRRPRTSFPSLPSRAFDVTFSCTAARPAAAVTINAVLESRQRLEEDGTGSQAPTRPGRSQSRFPSTSRASRRLPMPSTRRSAAEVRRSTLPSRRSSPAAPRPSTARAATSFSFSP